MSTIPLDALMLAYNAGKISDSVTRLAHKLGIPDRTLARWKSRADEALETGELVLDRYGLARIPQGDDATPEEQEPLHEIERRRLQQRNDALVTEKNDLIDRINATEDLRSALFGLTSLPLEPPNWTAKPTKRGRESEIPVLLTSDFQCGETIDLDETDGLNAYNIDIFRARYRRMIDRALDLLVNHSVSPSYPVFYYLRGGDAVSGSIHEELAETNELSSIPSLKVVAGEEARGIQQIHDHLGCPVRVISIPGNHDRTTMKKRHKKYVETSYDDITAWYLERHFAASDSDWASFHAPRSGDALFQIYSHWFFLTHGDRIGSGGGQGFIGPVAPIARGMKKIVDQYAALGKRIDSVLVGHFHTALEVEHGYSNGSLAGYSEFARDMRARPSPPTQRLFKVHPKRGIVRADKIFVGGPGEGSLCEFAEAA